MGRKKARASHGPLCLKAQSSASREHRTRLDRNRTLLIPIHTPRWLLEQKSRRLTLTLLGGDSACGSDWPQVSFCV